MRGLFFSYLGVKFVFRDFVYMICKRFKEKIVDRPRGYPTSSGKMLGKKLCREKIFSLSSEPWV